MNIFVAGTDTSVGKTVVSAILCLKLDWGYWKPIQSGTADETDSAWIKRHVNASSIKEEAYRLRSPLSPHRSAQLDKIRIDPQIILKHCKDLDRTVIEGAGGLLVPINEDFLLIDLIKEMNVPLLLVARSGLGTINHTLLSLAAIRARKIPLLGVVMVGDLNPANLQAIEYYGKVQVLGEIPFYKQLERETLVQAGALIKLGEPSYEHSIHA